MQAGDDLSDVGSGDDEVWVFSEMFLRPLAQSRAFVITVKEPSVGRVGKVQFPKEAKGGAGCADAQVASFFAKKRSSCPSLCRNSSSLRMRNSSGSWVVFMFCGRVWRVCFSASEIDAFYR